MAKRKLFTLTDPQVEFLEARAKKLGIKVAEYLRRLIDQEREKVQ